MYGSVQVVGVDAEEKVVHGGVRRHRKAVDTLSRHGAVAYRVDEGDERLLNDGGAGCPHRRASLLEMRLITSAPKRICRYPALESRARFRFSRTAETVAIRCPSQGRRRVALSAANTSSTPPRRHGHTAHI